MLAPRSFCSATLKGETVAPSAILPTDCPQKGTQRGSKRGTIYGPICGEGGWGYYVQAQARRPGSFGILGALDIQMVPSSMPYKPMSSIRNGSKYSSYPPPN